MAAFSMHSILAGQPFENACLVQHRNVEVQPTARHSPSHAQAQYSSWSNKRMKASCRRGHVISTTSKLALPAISLSSSTFRRQTQCRAASADGLKRREYRIEDLQSPDVHSLLKNNFHKFRPIEADEHHWDRQSFQQPQDSEPGTSGSSGTSVSDAEVGTEDIGIPVYVMLPLDTIRIHTTVHGQTVSSIQNEVALEVALHTLREAGVTGVMVDVWWGIVERHGPGIYDYTAYRRLFHKIASAGLKIQAVMSFHAAGSNVGDTCTISLPRWVLDIGDRDPDIFYTDKAGHRNRECLSIGCDHVPIFWGRTPLMVYESFMRAFCDEFQHLFGEVVTEITLGCGPAGELRYPAYPEGDRRWRFPGVGEFQCYDKYMLAELKAYAEECNEPDWGLSGPHDAGNYCSRAEHTGFFHPEWGSWKTPYGQFFLRWYSSTLVRHADSMLSIAKRILEEDGRPRELKRVVKEDASRVSFSFQPTAKLGLKLAGVHWGYRTAAHAAELTAGYWNTWNHNGYEDIFRVVKKYGGVLSFTCVEMRDCEHPPEGACSPEGLLEQIIQCSERNGVPLTGENALQRYDHHGLQRIRDGAMRENANRGRLSQLTFLRMGHLMFDHWGSFTNLVHEMARLWPQYQPEEPELDQLVDVDWDHQ